MLSNIHPITILNVSNLYSLENSFKVKIMVPNGVSVVTTTWNERENIEKLVSTIRCALQNLPHEIIIVDDNSPDGTIHIAKLLADVAITKPREGQTKSKIP